MELPLGVMFVSRRKKRKKKKRLRAVNVNPFLAAGGAEGRMSNTATR